MKTIVVIPCWRRPGHLAALLHTIRGARGFTHNLYMFTVDRGYDPDILDVINEFSGDKIVTLRDHRYPGTVCNILSAYREAYVLALAREIEYVALLEEDLLVTEDIFEYYADAFELVARDPSHVGVSACRNQNTLDGRMPLSQTNVARVDSVMRPRAIAADVAETAAVYTHRSYQSIGSAVTTAFLPKIIEHAKSEYYSNQIGYCTRELASDLPDAGASQDGLIHRIIRREGLAMIYPLAPRAFHVGWYGINRHGLPFDVPWRAAAPHILTMTADQMNERADPRFRDIEVGGLIRDRVPLSLV